MNEWQRHYERERRRRVLWAIAGWLCMIASAIVMVLVLWLAYLGLVVVFGGM